MKYHFLYINTTFLVLMPLFKRAMLVNNYTILYLIYFFTILSALYIFPFKKVIISSLLFLSSAMLTYRVMNKKYVGLDDISSVMESNFGESLAFILSSYNYFLILIPLFFVLLVAISRIHFKYNFQVALPIFFTGVLSLFFYEKNYKDSFAVYPLKIYRDFQVYQNELGRIRDGYTNITNTKLSNPVESDITVHLVIGESSRRDHYSICKPYMINATPELEALKVKNKLIGFCNAKSVAFGTRHSVTSMLSSRDIKDFNVAHKYKNILHIMNSFGIETNVYENNALPSQKNNIHKSLTLANFIPAKKVYFGNGGHDLDFIKKILPSISETKSSLNIIHLKGNHIRYSDTYPSDFLLNDLNHPYYKSIRYTDIVLSEIIKSSSSSRNNTAVLYVSDHGEYLNDFSDGMYGHGMQTFRRYGNSTKVLDYLTDIPFFIHMNKSYTESYKITDENLRKSSTYRISHDNVFHTLLGLFGLGGHPMLSDYKEEYDLTSASFQEKPRYVYNSDINYNILHSNAFILVED